MLNRKFHKESFHKNFEVTFHTPKLEIYSQIDVLTKTVVNWGLLYILKVIIFLLLTPLSFHIRKFLSIRISCRKTVGGTLLPFLSRTLLQKS